MTPVLSPNFLVDALGKMIAGAAKILQHYWEEALIDALNQVRPTTQRRIPISNNTGIQLQTQNWYQICVAQYRSSSYEFPILVM